jgi:hypothetical protein
MTPIPLGILAAQISVAAGSYDLLETEILTGSQTSVTFSSLNSTYGADYQHLQARCVFSGGGVVSSLRIQLNGDTGSNYSISHDFMEMEAALHRSLLPVRHTSMQE